MKKKMLYGNASKILKRITNLILYLILLREILDFLRILKLEIKLLL